MAAWPFVRRSLHTANSFRKVNPGVKSKVFRAVRFRRGSLRNGYHIEGRQQARKLPSDRDYCYYYYCYDYYS